LLLQHEQRTNLLSFPTSTGLSLNELFTEIERAKVRESGDAAVICASHDLAPIIEKVFGIKKGYEKEKAFVSALKKSNKSK
jgi:hypothetical protein